MTRRRRYDASQHRTNERGTMLSLPSGYRIRVRSLPPYYADIVDAALPMPEYPKREITLMAGDTIRIEYQPPITRPEPDSGYEYDLYMRWLAVDEQRVAITDLRKRARMDYLLATCVTVVDGEPGTEDFHEPDWTFKVEAAFPDYKVPTHPGKRMLVFLKVFVITTPEWMNLILTTALTEEATMQGVMTALQGFRHPVG